MKDFVAEVAGQTILRLVSRGNAIIAELLRLSSHIPPVFFLNAPEHRRYESILFDFKYLQNQDYCESKIEDSAVSYFYLAHTIILFPTLYSPDYFSCIILFSQVHDLYIIVFFFFFPLQLYIINIYYYFSTKELVELDSEFRENHLEILRRFYLLFESIYKYIKDFRHYLSDLDAGVFIQLTLEV